MHTLDELTLLPEERAVQRWFDGRNFRLWRLLALALMGTNAVLVAIYASEGATFHLQAAIVHLLALVTLWFLRTRHFFVDRFRAVLLTFLVTEFVVVAFASERELLITVAYVLFPVIVVFLRLRPGEHLALLAGSSIVGAATVLQGQAAEGTAGGSVLALAGQLLALSLPPAAYLVCALLLTRRARLDFLARWREASTRERDRLRMRDELADARRIQLSMLPETAPRLSWLEVSGSSLPASEVGGDFYDYLELPDGRLAVVIGDVAGHGVSSGLVLATLKGGLHLLRDELARPGDVLARLDRMLLETVRWRVIVTLLVAVFDPARRRLDVVAAGHPPALHLASGTGEVRSVGFGARPLGTRLTGEFRTDGVDLAEGDVVLLVTDGVTELAGRGANPFGDERLARALERARDDGATARSMRESILDTLSTYKRDAPQADDITLVVARVGHLGGHGARGD
ncbi:MAG TPA: PP2C family protein-serine/threonine phosphatase [Thermoanaerobaculia bacterium]|nr:PP2C family protein-serine/threonine phosphatase [Thermoanaerobaculia bacterium]